MRNLHPLQSFHGIVNHPGTGMDSGAESGPGAGPKDFPGALRGKGLPGILFGLVLILTIPVHAFALQVHSSPEGLYSHQMGHIFFVVGMAILAFWLQKTRLSAGRGWKYIQISCLVFILWNFGAMAGHVIEAEQGAEAFVRISSGRALVVEKAVAPYLFYFLKLDHLFAVPAMIFLLLGLKRLKRESLEDRA